MDSYSLSDDSETDHARMPSKGTPRGSRSRHFRHGWARHGLRDNRRKPRPAEAAGDSARHLRAPYGRPMWVLCGLLSVMGVFLGGCQSMQPEAAQDPRCASRSYGRRRRPHRK